MPSLRGRLELVHSLRGARTDAALIAALQASTAPEADEIARVLLARAAHVRKPGLVREILAAWHELSVDRRSASALLAGPLLCDMCVGLAADPRARARRASAGIAGYLCRESPCGEPPARPWHVLTQLAHDAADDVWTTALDVLAGLIDGMPYSELVRPDIDDALAAAAERTDSNRHAAFTAALVRVAHVAGPRLRAWLHDAELRPALGGDSARAAEARGSAPGRSGHMALRSAARQLPLAEIAPRVVSWLSIPALAPVAIQRLPEIRQSGGLGFVLEQAHLLRARGRGARLLRIGDAHKLLPAPPEINALSPRARRGVVGWAESLPIRRDALVAYLASLSACTDARVRCDAAHALRRLADQGGNGPVDAALIQLAGDADGRVASAAAGALAAAASPHRRASLVPALRSLAAESGHVSVRHTCNEALSLFDPWHRASGLMGHVCVLPARRIAATDRARLDKEAREALSSADPLRRLHALELIERLGRVHDVIESVERAVRDADSRVAAKATLVLSRAAAPKYARILRSALTHQDPRVRASAVEGVARMGLVEESLADRLSDSSARTRANAVRCFLRQQPSTRSLNLLADMLRDERPDHRISGLWVAERHAETDLAGPIARLAREDQDPLVRRRALRCAKRLLAEMRMEWGTFAGHGPGAAPHAAPLASHREATAW